MTLKYDIPPTQIYYPDSDGQPMAESDFQRVPLIYAIDSLTLFFENRPDVYVSGDMFIYYEEGRPESVVAPDVFVVFGVTKHKRNSYKLWVEGQPPSFVMEITSEATRTRDQGPKRGIYAFLGITEYFQYDPTGDYLKPLLQGWRLQDGNYMAVPTSALNGTLSVYSEVLGLELRTGPTKGEFRFFDPRTRTALPSYAEMTAARQAAEVRAHQEALARQEAEARAAEAQAELERLRAELARLQRKS